MYEDLNRGSSGWQAIGNVQTTGNGGGSYTLRWTVPQGASAYRIKYAEKPLVEWLGFDKASRIYQFDPASYTPWFSASNVTNEPSAGSSGTTQQFDVAGLDPARQWYFMVKYRGPVTSDTTGPAPVSDLRTR
jgi:hypothetical protein